MLMSQKIDQLKSRFKIGSEVMLLSQMDDPQPISFGTTGIVRSVDDVGTVHVKWSDQRTLGCVLPEDVICLVSELIEVDNLTFKGWCLAALHLHGDTLPAQVTEFLMHIKDRNVCGEFDVIYEEMPVDALIATISYNAHQALEVSIDNPLSKILGWLIYTHNHRYNY